MLDGEKIVLDTMMKMVHLVVVVFTQLTKAVQTLRGAKKEKSSVRTDKVGTIVTCSI